jgi:hypothetical protein
LYESGHHCGVHFFVVPHASRQYHFALAERKSLYFPILAVLAIFRRQRGRHEMVFPEIDLRQEVIKGEIHPRQAFAPCGDEADTLRPVDELLVKCSCPLCQSAMLR